MYTIFHKAAARRDTALTVKDYHWMDKRATIMRWLPGVCELVLAGSYQSGRRAYAIEAKGGIQRSLGSFLSASFGQNVSRCKEALNG